MGVVLHAKAVKQHNHTSGFSSQMVCVWCGCIPKQSSVRQEPADLPSRSSFSSLLASLLSRRSCFSISALIRLDSFASSLRQQAIMESKVITAWAGGKKARLRRGVGLTPHTKYQIKKKRKKKKASCVHNSPIPTGYIQTLIMELDSLAAWCRLWPPLLMAKLLSSVKYLTA